MSVLANPVIEAVRRQMPHGTPTHAQRGTIDLTVHGHTIVAHLRNRDEEALTVHLRSFTVKGMPASHTVQPGRELNAAWQADDDYDLSLFAPHGSYRQIAGRCGEPQVEAKLRTRGSRVQVKLLNPTAQPMELRATQAGETTHVQLKPFARRTLDLTVGDEGYEVALAVVGTTSTQVLAGHL